MHATSKSLVTLAITAILGSSPAQAVVVDFLYNTPTDGSGKTSRFIPTNNMPSAATGYFIETFDQATNQGVAGVSGPYAGQTSGGANQTAPYIGIVQNQGCAINTLAIAGALTVSDGSFTVRKGTVSGVGATPANDTTCFGFGPGPSPRNDGSNATVRVDYSAFLDPNVKISYLGLYYGSIDTYNNIAFYSGGALVTGGGGILDDGVITGQEVLTEFGGSSGNQTSNNSNVYVNLFFAANETFDGFEFRTTGVAFEVDNIVTGLTNRNDVPEPGTLALLGIALAAIGVVGSKRRV